MTLIPGVGAVSVRALLERFGSASAVFRARPDLPWDFASVDATLTFCKKHDVAIWCPGDTDYPFLLSQIPDKPTILYYKGPANLNHPRILSIVGTRLPSPYGKQIVSEIVRDLAPYEILVVSGLADGIDGLAHQAALSNGLHTVGVLAHGLDTIYPSGNRKLAWDMLKNGGLLTEYIQGTRPEVFRFPLRNRIIAGLAAGTVVIESATEGGSMITANLARAYNREVLAVPGRITDIKSGGCNKLIRDHIAAIATGAADITVELGWGTRRQVPVQVAPPNGILDLLRNREWVHIDELRTQTKLSNGELASTLLNLELGGRIVQLAGNRYRLIH